ncbi:MAG: class I SAM-dependent methyltransferase [Deltaproteobacteria bacterium]|nr:class I SAM-dependent methyltransferase [Deltaproteobacteria bacterium]
MSEKGEIHKFWNSRANLLLEAGTKDIISKRLGMQAIAKYVQDGMKVLDVGCGNGVTALELVERHAIDITGFDYAEEMIKAANENLTKKKLTGKCVFFVHDLKNVGVMRGAFDLVYTERTLINLQSWEEQESAIRTIVGLLRPNARYLMCENSQDALDRLNAMRAQAGLDVINTPWHNRYLREDEVESILLTDAKIECIENFSSTYYFLSRIVNAWLSRREGKEPAYDATINKLALNLSPIGDVGQTKLWVWKKNQ